MKFYRAGKLIFTDEVKHELIMPDFANSLYPLNMSLEDEIKRLFDFRIENYQWLRPTPSSEEIMDEFRRNGRDFEYCPELERGEIPAHNIRRKKTKRPLPTECVFCKNNGEQESYYKSHLLKDVNGKTTCPVLKAYTCPICGAKGEDSHTVKYCPLNKNGETMPTFNTMKLLRNSTGKRRYSK
ncbi:nanos homolog 3 [Diachasmimorpha longicaudata]|uniref:nanos homolog 3 n=1 Tax=Diachasmimorpha longicaudata TaxID=58733 RepID=UPI0030B896C8